MEIKGGDAITSAPGQKGALLSSSGTTWWTEMAIGGGRLARCFSGGATIGGANIGESS